MGLLLSCRKRTGSRSRKRLTQSWSQLHHRFRARAHRRSCAGAMKRSSVRASLTTGATCAAASISIRISSRKKDARLDRLHHQNALQNAPIDQRHSQERLILLLARLPEVLEARMQADLFHRDRMDLLGDQSGEPFMQREAQCADAFSAQSQRRRQHEIGAVRLQQIRGTDIRVESAWQSKRPHSSKSRRACRLPCVRLRISSKVKT